MSWVLLDWIGGRLLIPPRLLAGSVGGPQPPCIRRLLVRWLSSLQDPKYASWIRDVKSTLSTTYQWDPDVKLDKLEKYAAYIVGGPPDQAVVTSCIRTEPMEPVLRANPIFIEPEPYGPEVSTTNVLGVNPVEVTSVKSDKKKVTFEPKPEESDKADPITVNANPEKRPRVKDEAPDPEDMEVDPSSLKRPTKPLRIANRTKCEDQHLVKKG